MHQTCFAGLMGSLHISGFCIMTKIYTQLDGARLTASPFSHPHNKVSDMLNVIVNFKTVDREARITTKVNDQYQHQYQLKIMQYSQAYIYCQLI